MRTKAISQKELMETSYMLQKARNEVYVVKCEFFFLGSRLAMGVDWCLVDGKSGESRTTLLCAINVCQVLVGACGQLRA